MSTVQTTYQIPLRFCEAQTGRWQPAGLTEGQIPRKRRSENVLKARQLRRDMSLPEVLLWNLLRRSPDGVSFRRQHAIEPYVLDFFNIRSRTGFEIDGIAHEMGDRPQRDERRDAFFRKMGIEIVRIPAVDVLKSAEVVADAMVRYCQR
ncbi:DUF559 domain-containing protein [Novosphingobium sp.]|uniref:endonuclease domain-containing protein n=1 Tax=Novosphingobium sp. TaxID=1874826 RepID=UPI0025F5B121|nr:DUF559 domain-containing protein [Novosphingobium sp.]